MFYLELSICVYFSITLLLSFNNPNPNWLQTPLPIQEGVAFAIIPLLALAGCLLVLQAPHTDLTLIPHRSDTHPTPI